ncbi:uncharacterized protein (TIGR02118 family) [Rubricella aquisinus]|uniref:Uncharacterized protein (TIGR02118 family) n=1 Tax=Rubricella aquisinus TaxID=2028108 RepID=A0A840X4A4_9RHOB|nr:EthD family reductase [Rubricella aquisinus]MBB5516636.1 uncharacterized protein (TIGR02118 family) [Rubricella aquisinus]
MAATLTVMYPITDETTFDFDYYGSTHMPLVGKVMKPDTAIASKGLAGGPDTSPGFYAVATVSYADMAALQAALADADEVLADIPNYYNAQPIMLIGETL